MTRSNGLVSVFRGFRIGNTVAEHWRESSKWLMYTLVGGLVPVWGGMFLFKLFSRPVSFSDFSSNGEFALYSATMLAPSLYLILKDYNSSNFLYRHTFALASVLGLLVSMILFAGVTAVHAGGMGSVNLDQRFLRWVTMLLFLVAVGVSFLVTALDNERIGIDVSKVREERANQVKDLEKQFDKL